MRKIKLSKKKKKKKLKECVLLPMESYYDLLKHYMVCQFIHDINQGTNGALYLTAEMLDDAQEVINNATEMYFQEKLDSGMILNNNIIYVED